jgi:hypothetical protein
MISFTVSGLLPTGDPLWQRITPQGKAEALTVFRLLALQAKRRELALGLDKDGKPMLPISSLTAKSRALDLDPVTGHRPYSPMGRADPRNAPLQSTGDKSRTQSLLNCKIADDVFTFWWGFDPATGRNWGDFLAMHAAGFEQTFADGRTAFVPPRDVIGLSPQYADWLKRQIGSWWLANRARLSSISVSIGTQHRVYFPAARPRVAKSPETQLATRPAYKSKYQYEEVSAGTIVTSQTGGSPGARWSRVRVRK